MRVQHCVRGISVLFLAALCVCGGCMSSKPEMDQSNINTIQKGVTTRAEVEAKFGTPDDVSIMPDGNRMMVYRHQEAHTKATSFIPVVNMFAGGADTKQQTLEILIDSRSIVKDYEFTDHVGEIRSGMFGYTQTEGTAPTASK